MEQIQYNPIPEQSLNDKLVNLYGSHLIGLYSAVEPIFQNENLKNPALPLLIELADEDMAPYETADIRIMVFGRENNDWSDTCYRGQIPYTENKYNFNIRSNADILNEIRGLHDVEAEKEIYGICDIYHTYCYEDNGVRKNSFTRHKDNLIKKISSQLPGMTIGEVYNNVHKIGLSNGAVGKSCGIPPRYIQEIEEAHFNVVAKEIEILKPDIVIFLTGSQADNTIRKKFGIGNQEFEKVGEKLYRINIPGIKYAVRTIHPCARVSNEERDRHIDALVRDVVNFVKCNNSAI